MGDVDEECMRFRTSVGSYIYFNQHKCKDPSSRGRTQAHLNSNCCADMSGSSSASPPIIPCT